MICDRGPLAPYIATNARVASSTSCCVSSAWFQACELRSVCFSARTTTSFRQAIPQPQSNFSGGPGPLERRVP